MNPDKQLSQQLEKVSGWKPPYILRKYSLSDEPIELARPPKDMEIAVLSGEIEWEISLYTSDYLLDKLPYRANDQNLEIVPRHDKTWYAGYSQGKTYFVGGEEPLYFAEADTPVDALMKLCLELFEQKILTKGKD